MLSNDCCADSQFASSSKRRQKEFTLKKNSSDFHCHETTRFDNPIPGLGFYLKASCSDEWLGENLPSSSVSRHNEARVIKEKCEFFVAFKKKTLADYKSINKAIESQVKDPLGLMMYITDSVSGITYANSYCLQCNSINLNQSRLVYWLPKLKFNYSNPDNGKKLMDLVRKSEGKALKYSETKNSWFIDIETYNEELVPSKEWYYDVLSRTKERQDSNSITLHTNSNHDLSSYDGGQSTVNSVDKETESSIYCKIEPAMPKSIRHLIRTCSENVVDTCDTPKADQGDTFTGNKFINQLTTKNGTFDKECRLRHQDLVYSRTSRRIFKNKACAYCSNEFDLQCQLPKFNWGDDIDLVFFDISGASLNILLDYHASSSETHLVPLVRRCSSDAQIYDMFHSACRHIICGLNKLYQHGKCIAKTIDPHEVALKMENDTMIRYASLKETLSLVNVSANHHDNRSKAKNSKQSFEECGKIRLARTEFRLMNRTSLGKNITIAYVMSNNLTLKPDEFSLEPNKELLICSPFKTNLGRKFKPIMGIITTIGLFISVVSLIRYLSLHIISTWFTGKHRDGNSDSVRRHNSSLPSRGRVCLSSSLLAAYLLFLAGQQLDYISRNYEFCLTLAIGTHFCFLLSFNWMFILSYDSWKMCLRANKLRRPIEHSQSKTFLVYTIYSLAATTTVVAAAVFLDLQPTLHKSTSISDQFNHAGNNQNISQIASVGLDRGYSLRNFFDIIVIKITKDYKPRFCQPVLSKRICWFTNRRALALFFGVPVTLMMMINLLFFVHSSSIILRNSYQTHKVHFKDNGEDPSKNKRPANKSIRRTHSDQTMEIKQFSCARKNKSISYENENREAITNFAGNCIFEKISIKEIVANDLHNNNTETNRTAGNNDVPTQEPTECLSTPKENVIRSPEHEDHDAIAVSISSNSSSVVPLVRDKADSITTIIRFVGNLPLKQRLRYLLTKFPAEYRPIWKLSVIMGLTWLIGVVASITNSDILWYPFVILNTLQGLFIFVAFGCNKSN